MEEAIEIDLVEEQSYNTASVTPWQKPATERSAPTPMELCNADVVCYKCGKRGHVMSRCYAKVAASAEATIKKNPYPKGGVRDPRARRTEPAPTKLSPGNVEAQ